MVAKRQCSFCAQEIEPGTGTIFVKRDGTVYQFCSSSCRKQQLHLGRIGHRFKWTRAFELKRAAERSGAERASAPGPSRAAAPRAKPAHRGEAPTEPVAAAAASGETETPAPAPVAKKPRTKAVGKAPPKAAKSAAKPAPKAAAKAAAPAESDDR
jgi:large subunit ribosomal protein L24e